MLHRGALDWVAKMRMVVSTELVLAISAFNAEDPASAVRAGEAKVGSSGQRLAMGSFKSTPLARNKAIPRQLMGPWLVWLHC